MKVTIIQSCARIAATTLLVGVFGLSASAQSPPRATTLTFSQDVRVPGMTLKAGTYEFVMRVSGAPILQVYRTKPWRLMGVLMMQPAIRSSEGPFVTFWDTPRGATPLMRVWYPSGSKDGYALIYPPGELQAYRTAPGVEFATH